MGSEEDIKFVRVMRKLPDGRREGIGYPTTEISSAQIVVDIKRAEQGEQAVYIQTDRGRIL